MQPLVRAVRAEGDHLRVPWAGLDQMIRPRPGNLVLVQAAPGVGKSIFALSWVLKSKAKALICSWDTDLATQGERVAAATLNARVADIPKDEALEALADIAPRQFPGVRFFDLAMGVDDLPELLEAEREFLGDYPEIVVIDNVGDLVEEESAAAYQTTFLKLLRLARKTRSSFLCLHHIRRKPAEQGGGDSAAEKVRRQDGLYGGDRLAEIVLGLWRPQPGMLRVGILKNRSGSSDPNGGLYVDLQTDFSRVQLSASLVGMPGAVRPS